MTEDEKQTPVLSESVFRSYIDKLDAIKTENERLLGRNTLVISGGAFTLSITLLKDLYPAPLQWTKYFLIASWVVFGLSAFLQFYSDYLSCRAMDVQRKNTEACYPDNQDKFDRLSNKYADWVQGINKITPWIICLGFLCMIVFSTSNFLDSKGGQMKDQATDQTWKTTETKPKPSERGVTPPPPPKPLPPKPKPPEPKTKS